MITPQQFKTAREATGLTQEQAGRILGTSRVSVARTETGKIASINTGWYRLLLSWGLIPDDTKQEWLNGKSPEADLSVVSDKLINGMKVKPAANYAADAVPHAMQCRETGNALEILIDVERIDDAIFHGVLAGLSVPIIEGSATYEATETRVLNKHGAQGYTIAGGGDAITKILAAENGGLVFAQAAALHTTTFYPQKKTELQA